MVTFGGKIGWPLGGRLKGLPGCGEDLFLDVGDGDVDLSLFDNSLKCAHKPCNVSICQTAIKELTLKI